VNKKYIIIAAAGGLASFAGAFTTVWLTGRSAAPVPVVETAKQTDANSQGQPRQAGADADSGEAVSQTTGDNEQETAKGLDEKQLKGLVFEVREKIREYEGKSKELDVREARLQITQETLKKDIEELNRLRVELASLVANLKEQKSRLMETRAVIAQSEKTNLTSIAATYDKMDATSASKIISSMCAKQMESGKMQLGGPIDDATKILYYMTDRTKGKLLAEMVTSEPKLAAVLCQRLKQISEVK
jgi:flagellar motility protein MotE (MotC chaperone)